MGETLKEIFTNRNDVTWIRTHATDTELSALCRPLNVESDGVTVSSGDITCPDCIGIIKRCQSIKEENLKPEYENQLFWKRLDKN